MKKKTRWVGVWNAHKFNDILENCINKINEVIKSLPAVRPPPGHWSQRSPSHYGWVCAIGEAMPTPLPTTPRIAAGWAQLGRGQLRGFRVACRSHGSRTETPSAVEDILPNYINMHPFWGSLRACGGTAGNTKQLFQALRDEVTAACTGASGACMLR